MERLWAPWRRAYIYAAKQKGCIFCGARRVKNDRARYIVARTRHAFSMLNLYPYNNGHVMVAPYRHVKSLEYLTEAETKDCMALVNKMKRAIDKTLKPHGYNIGMNIGRVAGAGFEAHAHIHIVPRWPGDSNFMPVLSKTKVISDSLDHLYDLLKAR